jgi:predicted DNA-binding ArsR family transcriptional regulator
VLLILPLIQILEAEAKSQEKVREITQKICKMMEKAESY